MALLVMGRALWQYRHRYDILHVYQLNWLALVTALSCYFSRKPMVVVMCSADPGRKDWSQHEVSLSAGPLDAHNPMLHITRDTRVGGDLKDLAKLGKPLVRFTRTLFQRTNTVVIILSTRMREYLAAHDFTLTNVLLIPNGVDTARFHPLSEDASESQRSQTVVCIARLSYEKGLDVLLQAWHLVHQELPDARLIVAGKGPLQAQLAYMVKALDIEECVEFLGQQSDVAAVLHRGGIAALPSRWEGMPNALLEAMACGLPCVATRVSGTEDIIVHEVNGLLVEPEDYQGMAQALLALLRDPARTSAYGKAARATIAQDYTLEHITDIYVKLYQRMVGNSKLVTQINPSESQPPAGPATGAI
jgi:glycosyltransferase involved in cell wall biosynthesis